MTKMKTNVDWCQIEIKGISSEIIIGIYDKERVNKQLVMVDVIVMGNFNQACLTDSIDDTLNYETIENKVLTILKQNKKYLVESLGKEIADNCLLEKNVNTVEVTIHKPHALKYARDTLFKIRVSQ